MAGMVMDKDLQSLSINAIRMLALDAVEQAKSGHPGMPMGMAPAAYVLWTEFLKHNPTDPFWPDRDRFVLSAGHGSMLLYALLHLTGYDLPLEELKRFRQWGSKTPGHPEYEYHHHIGVETTTGPLGQGISTAVGMAIAERKLAAEFGAEIVDHYTYVIASDGDLMEGVSSEASSLAGHLRLGKLIVLYDDNDVSIDGNTELAFTEDRMLRYEAYGWHVIRGVQGEDLEAIRAAIRAAQADPRPSIISVRSIIGFGSPLAGNHKAHSDAMGPEKVAATRQALGWEYPPFVIPDRVYADYRRSIEKGQKAQAEWQARFDQFAQAEPEKAAEFKRRLERKLPDLSGLLPSFSAGDKLATRAASGKTLEKLAPALPELVGGSADLTPSNNTKTPDMTDFSPANPTGRYIRYGVREHGMGAAMNGIVLHGGYRPYGGTFLVFSDYMRPSIRMAAIMGIPTVFVFTHDSIAVGEDGPTHQPIEHVMSLRAIPNLWVIRPADAGETAVAWKMALERVEGPTALALTRQALPVLEGVDRAGVERGGYVISDVADPRGCIVATGSEVSLALEAQKLLAEQGIPVRVVSLPCWEAFEQQPQEYREAVLPKSLPTVSVEAGTTLGWERYADRVVGLERFGASAPYPTVYQNLGFTKERVADEVKALLGV